MIDSIDSSHVETMRKVFESWKDPDPTVSQKLLDDLLHPDVVVVESESLPMAGVWRGPEGYKKLMETIANAFDEFNVEPQEFINSGDYVTIFTTITGKAKTTGNSWKTKGICFWKFKGHKIIEVRPYYMDVRAITEAMKNG